MGIYGPLKIMFQSHMLMYGEANVNGKPHGLYNADVIVLVYFHDEPKRIKTANPRD